jgi:uncharacterized protein YlxP (DUF503 family)
VLLDTVPDPDLFISLLTIELLVPWARSLKDKRSAVRGLKDRLRSRFNASVAEVGYQDKWQRAVLAVCVLGNDKRQLESDMSRVRQLCEEAQDLQIADIHQQWL